MAKTKNTGSKAGRKPSGDRAETHQTARSADQLLTTNQGQAISDNQNSLRSGARGPTLLEDFVLREKITHFDHERIPERIVHARGTGAHGFFQPYKSLARYTRAGFLQDPKKKTEVFVRFSTVAGGADSVDLPRDVRGFAVKFYTDEGNFDLVGNNIPVFFIQDAMKFPDLVHAVKKEPDRGFPSAASAHDTFWDFISLMPESFHMILWAMSDRTIPRSFRMMEGFGVHTFRLVDAAGVSTFVKFHWRPKIGSQSVVWDEAMKISGADPDFHRRDLWNAIEAGDFPEYELSIQAFDQETADSLPFDVLDATKLIPEEVVPLQPIGKMVLNRNVDNFFAETEQAAFHPGNVVPGIDFTNDPLLQGRLFSYIDTQLIRLGGPNFHEIPINKPRCPFRNFTRDGHMQMLVPKGRVAYEPNSLAPESPRESPNQGFVTHPGGDGADEEGSKLRIRADSFADHYSQARLFFRSMSVPEQQHIISAFAFELAKVETVAVRKRVLGHIAIIDKDLLTGVEEALGMEGQADRLEPARKPIDLPPSPALSLVKKHKPTLAGRKVGVLIADGTDAALLDKIQAAVEEAGGRVELVGPKIGGVRSKQGKKLVPHHTITGGPSMFFDAAIVALSKEGAAQLTRESAAVDWVSNAFVHLKIIGHTGASQPLLDRARVETDEGLLSLEAQKGVAGFVAMASRGRHWAREPKLRSPG